MEKRKHRESTRWEDGNQEREFRRGIGCDGEGDESEERERKKTEGERHGIDGDSEWRDLEREVRKTENGNSGKIEFRDEEEGEGGREGV